MALTFRDGSVNIAAISTPGVAIDIIPPTPFVGAAPSNIEAFVGAASWGTPNTVMSASGAADGYAKLGRPQVRYGDLATALAAGLSKGSQGSYRFVRVTDGTDVAANVVLPTNFGRFTARSSGTLGNQIALIFTGSTAVGALSCILQFPGLTAERFDNIFTGLASVTTVPGTGYTSVPSAVVSSPQKALSAVQATVQPTLSPVSQAVAAGGTGYTVGDKITLANGHILTVATVTSGAVTTVTVQTPAVLLSGAIPANPVAQVSTTGSGTGATFTLVWGLGTPTLIAGGGYYTASGPSLTLTLLGGGGTGGSYTPVMTFGAALATAINLGTQQRAKSGYVVFTPGTGTGTPALNTPYQLASGTDGASSITSLLQAGQDGAQTARTGAYALRTSGMDMFTLVDCTDPTIVPAMLALGIDETAAFDYSEAKGGSIAGAVANRQTLGFDDTNIHYCAGDWPTFNDGVNGPRQVYPSLFALGLAANLSPEQSFINKPLPGVLSTEASSTGVLISNADNAVAQDGGVDIIGRTASLGADYFSFVTGRTTSSNTAARGIEYIRLTNFIARSLNGPATRSIVGLLQSTNRADDPTRTKAKSTLDSFFGFLKSPAYGSGGYGIIEDAAVQCDLNNNPPTSVQRGFLIAYCAVLYLNVVRVFLIKLNGAGNIQLQSVPTGTGSLTQALASVANISF